MGNGETRVFKETAALGKELKKLGGDLLGAVSDAKAAIYFDWDNWWALNCTAGPTMDLEYKAQVLDYYKALHGLNIPVDFVGANDGLDKYKLLIAPVLYMTKTGYDEKVRRFVEHGGTFVTTFFSGIVDEHDLVITGGYPGKLRDILGIWAEEIDALPRDKENSFDYNGRTYPARLLCDLIHPEGAKELGAYQKDFYAGMPAVTVNEFGKGRAYYVATRSDEHFFRAFLEDVCRECGIKPLFERADGMEATVRENENGRFLFLLNHGDRVLEVRAEETCVDLLTEERVSGGEEIRIEPKDVKIMRITQ